MNTIQKILWWIAFILAGLASLIMLPDLDRACDRDPGNSQGCTNPNHHHTKP